MVWIRCTAWRQVIWPQGPINLQSFLMRPLLPNNYLPTSQRPLFLMNKSSQWVNPNANVPILQETSVYWSNYHIQLFTNTESMHQLKSNHITKRHNILLAFIKLSSSLNFIFFCLKWKKHQKRRSSEKSSNSFSSFHIHSSCLLGRAIKTRQKITPSPWIT